MSSSTTSGSSSLELSGSDLSIAIVALEVEYELVEVEEVPVNPGGNLDAVDPILVVSSDDEAPVLPKVP